MYTPTHGAWCNARTYPTMCQYCGQRVFYFSCDCGCRVFFNSLGPPWPEHHCIEYAVHVLGPTAVQKAMAERMKTPGRWGPSERIASEYERAIIKRAQASKRQASRLIRRDPQLGKRVRAAGHVREVSQSVDVHKRFNIPEQSVLGDALLGQLANEPFAQVTLHTGDLSCDDGDSFTALVAARLLGGPRVGLGSLVEFVLLGCKVREGDRYWLCQSIRPVL